MRHLKISVITPSFNQGQFIEKTIKSVLFQDYPNFEYIILDSCSTDGTRKILQKYKKKCRIIIKKDKGMVYALNYGLKIAAGRIICYLNSDDLLTSHTLEKVNEYFLKNPKAEILTGDCKFIDGKGHFVRPYISAFKKLIPPRVRFSLPFLYLNNFIDQPSTFWTSALARKIGSFDEKLKLAMDYDYFLRASLKTKIYYLPEVLSNYRIHQSQKSKDYKAQFSEVYNISCRYNKNTLIKFLSFISCRLTIIIYETLSRHSRI